MKSYEGIVSINDFKSHIMEAFQDKIPTKLEKLRYIEPGHGLRGKQHCLMKDDNLEERYRLHTGKSEIISWTVCRQTNGNGATSGQVQ